MQMESVRAAGQDIAAQGALQQLEMQEAKEMEYQSQFLDNGDNMLHGLIAAIPMSLLLWLMIGLLLWTLMRK